MIEPTDNTGVEAAATEPTPTPAKKAANVLPPQQRVLKKAKRYVDEKYKEGPNNDTIFGEWYGLNHQPWCAMFVSKVFNEAGASKIIAASSPKGFASCQAGLSWFADQKRVIPVSKALPGDLVFFQFDDDPSADHIGIVVRNSVGTRKLVTYEGNTAGKNSGSQANGDGVYEKIRSYDVVMAAVRPAWWQL